MLCTKVYKQIISSSKRFSSQKLSDNNNNTVIYSILKPYLDFDERLKNIKKLEESIKLRGLDVNLTSLTALWNHYKSAKEELVKLGREKVKIIDEIEKLSGDEDRLKSLKFAGRNVRESTKRINAILNDLNTEIYPRVLELPNCTVEMTGNEIMFCDMKKPPNICRDHLEIGSEMGILEYISPRTYFLKSSASNLEIDINTELTRLFRKNNFLLFSNPDFTRNSIVKYLRLDDVQNLIPLEKQRDDKDPEQLHLHGGASLLPFSCFHSKSVTDITNLPVQYVTKSRHYSLSELPGLYGVWQNAAVQIFVGSREEDVDDHVQEAVNIVTDFYKMFNIPLRVIYCEPKAISRSEKLRISFQTYSHFYKEFFELGNLSVYGDYISKRLRIYYSDKHNNYHFMHIISGTILKFPPLLATLLEHNQDYVVKTVFNKSRA